MRIRIRWRHVGLASALAAVAAPAGWVASDAIERKNDTCTACHVDDVPLHLDLRRDFDLRPPRSLAALHAARMPGSRPEDPTMRCFDCHGGASFVGKARVKFLAVRDGVIWLAGRGEEPTRMDFPLWDEDCTQCHERFRPREDAYGPSPYHALDVHNTGTGFACVDCHLSHDTTVDVDYHHLDVAHVQQRCASCHAEFGN